LYSHRGKHNDKFIFDLLAKDILNQVSFRFMPNIMHVDMKKNSETFFRVAQMLKIFAPYFFKPHASKDGSM